jgi:hypothetical protein
VSQSSSHGDFASGTLRAMGGPPLPRHDDGSCPYCGADLDCDGSCWRCAIEDQEDSALERESGLL